MRIQIITTECDINITPSDEEAILHLSDWQRDVEAGRVQVKTYTFHDIITGRVLVVAGKYIIGMGS